MNIRFQEMNPRFDDLKDTSRAGLRRVEEVIRPPEAHRGTIAVNCDHVIATLRGHEAELRAFGVARLFVFGSTARGDGHPDSDIACWPTLMNREHCRSSIW